MTPPPYLLGRDVDLLQFAVSFSCLQPFLQTETQPKQGRKHGPIARPRQEQGAAPEPPHLLGLAHLLDVAVGGFPHVVELHDAGQGLPGQLQGPQRWSDSTRKAPHTQPQEAWGGRETAVPQQPPPTRASAGSISRAPSPSPGFISPPRWSSPVRVPGRFLQPPQRRDLELVPGGSLPPIPTHKVLSDVIEVLAVLL